jgi:hypothetical protein
MKQNNFLFLLLQFFGLEIEPRALPVTLPLSYTPSPQNIFKLIQKKVRMTLKKENKVGKLILSKFNIY